VAKTWEEELAEIGVREEKTASGAVRYKDTKTGKYISKDEVLKRIDNIPTKQVLTWEEGLAEIGVKEEKTASGAVRYKDTKTGKYISQDEVLRRIDNMPNKSVVKPEGGAVPGGTKPTEPKPETKPTTEPKPETKPTEPESPKGSPVGNPVKSKSQKIAEARKRGDLGYHGTDADIAMDDMIRSSANSSDGLGSVGYGIAKDYDAAEKYAVKRLVERQNLGKNIDFYREGDVLVIESSETLNLSNKTGYVYTTAKESSVEWHTLKNGYVGAFDAAQMPHSVEILDKKAFNLDDLVRQGKVKIIEPNVPKKAPKVTPTPAPKTAPKTTPTPSGGTKPKTTPTPVTPKRTPAQEEAEWRALYEKYAPENQTFDKFKESFGNNLDEVKEYSRAWEEKAIIDKGADERYQKQLADFRKKYGSDDAYYAYVRARYEAEEEAERLGKVYKMPDENTPILKSYTKEQIEDAKNIYQDARTDAVSASAGTPDDYYSTWDPSISKLKREAHQNMAVYSELNNHLNSKNLLTQAEYDNLLNYVEHRTYDEQMLISTFKKDPDLNGISARLYDNFLTAKSKNVRKIDDVAGLHAGSQSDFIATKGRNAIAKNEFVQNFVSKRVSMYEDIITKNPSIYNRAKKWNQLSIEEREKLCKEIFEIADDKLGVEHTGFAVRDLVADFGKSDATQGLQSAGYVYISNRHFPNMSFEDVMDVIAHEQAHKVDHLNPNKGILGSQLSDLGSTEGYIQGYKGHDYADYRLELTEQSSWLIGEEMKKAISRLGL